MKSISKTLMVITVLLSSLNGFAKIKPANDVAQNDSQLTTVFDNYFSIKDAMIAVTGNYEEAFSSGNKATYINYIKQF